MIAVLIGRIGDLHGQTLLRNEVILAIHLMLIPSLAGTNAIGYVKAIGELAVSVLLLVLLCHMGMGIVIGGKTGTDQ